MSVTRLYSLTAVSLAALYGVLGFAGESLHYLATDVGNLWCSPTVESGGYYHVHSPDYHGHFHRSSDHVGHSHHAGRFHTRVVVKPEREKKYRTVSFTTSQDAHPEHACPILTLVSTLKLSHVACCDALVGAELIVAVRRDIECVSAFTVTLNQRPRGPPARDIA
jgi:hypothetical protein